MVLNYWLSTLGLAFLNQIGTQYHFLAEWTCMGIDYQCFDHKDNPDGDFLCPEYSRYYGRDRHWYLLLVQGTSEANLYWIRYYVTNNWWCNIQVYFGKGQFKTQPRKIPILSVWEKEVICTSIHVLFINFLLHLYNYSMKRNLVMDVSDAILKETLPRKQ